MFLKNEKGVALAISLMVVIAMLVLGSIFIARSTSEKNMSDRGRMSVQSFYSADGGSHAGLNQLNILINTNMLATINATNPQVVGNDAAQYVGSNDSLGFLIKYVKDAGTAQFVLTGNDAKYTGTTTAFGNGNYRFDIFVSKKGNPITIATDVWDFPYYYRVETTGTSAGATRKIKTTGDFTVRVQRDNFAKYALFTDHHTTPSGTAVWFTDKTNFAGPIHTNDQYNFALNPSGTFAGAVTQQNTMAKFYNGGNPIQVNADNNAPYDVPTFNAGYTRGAAQIVLASSVQKQDLIDQARGGDSTPGNGIFIANNGSILTGGIYVKGDAIVNLGIDGNGNSLYTITEGTTTKNVTVNIASNQTQVETVGTGTQTFSGQPKGVAGLGTIIYVDGAITSLGGTVQKDTEVTVSSENDIVITNHLKYQDYTPASGTPGQIGYVPPNATDKTNLLGVVSWGGNVRIGATASNDIEIHGPVMARNGIFTVDNYNDTIIGPRGIATILGGAITQFYGAFGTFNGSTGQQMSGYGRNFTYDNRLAAGKAPPYFPSMKTFIAFTNDITDKIAWQEGGF